MKILKKKTIQVKDVDETRDMLMLRMGSYKIYSLKRKMSNSCVILRKYKTNLSNVNWKS